MKLTKKQLSASHAATVALLRDIDGVANHGNSRFDRCPMASPSKAKVEFIPHVSFSKTSGDKAMESIAGLENQPGVEITPLQLYVEEGPQSVSLGYLLRKWQGVMAMAATRRRKPHDGLLNVDECE